MKPGWFVHPVLSVILAAFWLLLQESLALPQLITAALLGLLVPRLVHHFLSEPAPAPALAPVLRLVAVVWWDIIVSNLTVARIVLSPWSNPQPAWVEVPLNVEHPRAITLLAAIITMTPGTVSCMIDEERSLIHVHALDCDDPAALAEVIRQRYGQPLKEIFG
jgi:multicomponent K+:H+ antiporter subunit E